MSDQLDHDLRQFWELGFRIVLDGEKRLGAYLAAHGLTPPQFYVLKTLSEQHGRCAIGEIARQHHLTSATMTGLVKRLELLQPPLVVRETSPADRRSVWVVLTEEGQARFLAVQADMMQQVRTILSLLQAEERETVLSLLRRYLVFMRQQPV